MTKRKAAAAGPIEFEAPAHGGSFTRDPATGALTCVEATEPAAIRAEPAADETAADDDQDAGGTAGDEQQQEG